MRTLFTLFPIGTCVLRRGPNLPYLLPFLPPQLEDGHSLFDYDVGLNDIIQLIIRPALPNDHTPSLQNGSSKETENENGHSTEDTEMVHDHHYTSSINGHTPVG